MGTRGRCAMTLPVQEAETRRYRETGSASCIQAEASGFALEVTP